MAEYQFGDDGSWTLIRLEQPPVSRVLAMREWLNDPARPGLWYWMARARADGPGELDVLLNHPDTAFEFKVRWA